MKLSMPFIVGSDFSGTVEAVGEGVTQWKIGDRVWGANQGGHGRQGTFAEMACVNQKWLDPTPEGIKREDVSAV